MRRNRKSWAVVIVIVGACVAAIIGAAVVLYVRCWIPNRKFMDLEWLETASKAEQVEVAHKVLSWPVGNHHDAFITLEYYGGPDSVPYLIRALWWQENTKPGEPMICTKAHCLSALRRLTGHNAGDNYRDWKRWWDSVGHQVPPRPTSVPAEEKAAAEHDPPGGE